MDAGFVDDLGRSLKARSGIFPVFFPVIPKIAFGDEFESDCVISQPVPSLGPCPARKNLCDVPAVYRDGGESLWRIFLVFRWVRRISCASLWSRIFNIRVLISEAGFELACEEAIRVSDSVKLRPVPLQ